MTANRTVAAWILLTATCLAISPHRLSREQVEAEANWVGRLQVISIQHQHRRNADEWEFRCKVVENKRGQAPDKMSYWESWPSRMPNGKTECPIWTGSGYEHQLEPGSLFLGIGRDGQLLRAERDPEAAEANQKP